MLKEANEKRLFINIFNFISARKTTLHAKEFILIFIVAVYPLVVIPGPLDYFRGQRYILLVATSLYALYYIVEKRINLKQPVLIPLGLFLFFIGVATLFAKDLSMAWLGSNGRFTGFSTYLFCVILFLLASYYEKPRQILVPMITCAAIVSIIGVMQFYGLNIVPHEYYSQNDLIPYSTMGNINWFGTYVVFILPAAILFYLYEKKGIWLLISAIIYAGLLVSFTRGAWLAFIVSFAIICVVLNKNKELKKQFFILVVIFALVTIALLFSNDWRLYKRAYTIPDALTSTASLVDDSFKATGSVFERLYIWKETTQIIKENWVFGIGADHLRIKMPSGRIEDKAHNIYLEIAVTMGLFALISYLAFLSFFLQRQTSKTGYILFMMVFTYLLQGLFNNDIVQIMPLFWIVLGLSLSNGNDQKNLNKIIRERIIKQVQLLCQFSNMLK